MGPIPPPNQSDDGAVPTKPRAIKWIDEAPQDSSSAPKDNDEQAKKRGSLVTNRSCDDLVHKKAEELSPVEVHKDASKQTGMKRAIKQFEIDRNKLTGLRNFTELSPDPLALPAYALPPTTATSASATAMSSQSHPHQRQGGASSQRDNQQRNSKNPAAASTAAEIK